ncbi:MAG: DUF3465 domain-containing protein [Gammaproteobacteria bacterium]|nr:DUF3465 domain-containing protein [Gammaproteobacteria bacterium]
MKRLLPALVFVVAVLGWNYFNAGNDGSASSTDGHRAVAADGDWRSGQQVRGGGEIIAVLSDDNDGSRHQRFIVRLSSGRTLLIAHNIDLAPRVPSIRVGDTVSFNGEYEWNDKGGVIHWTHRDPQNRHQAGWIEHKGKRYQ